MAKLLIANEVGLENMDQLSAYEAEKFQSAYLKSDFNLPRKEEYSYELIYSIRKP